MSKQIKDELNRYEAVILSKEIARLVLKENLTIKAAERRVLEEYKKAQSPATKQGKEHNKTFNNIISKTECTGNRDKGGI